MEEALKELARNSPLAAVALGAIYILWKVMEQKVEMAKRMSTREKELGEQFQKVCEFLQSRDDRVLNIMEACQRAIENNSEILVVIKEQLGKKPAKVAK